MLPQSLQKTVKMLKVVMMGPGVDQSRQVVTSGRLCMAASKSCWKLAAAPRVFTGDGLDGPLLA
jgi:hypothetical protein